MNKTFNFLLTLSFIFPLIYLTGCATLDRSECEVANWEIIGFEDGATGKPASTVGQHRSACAEYTIAPDLNLYLQGHKRGVVEYCTFQNGFELGQRGRNLTDVCSDVNYQEFKSGYQKGKQYYFISSDIKNTKSKIHSIRDEMQHISQDIKQNEELIISSGTSSLQRRQLLETNKTLEVELNSLKGELFQQESLLFELEDKYAKLTK